jgi:GxxExxY protein
MNEELDRLTNGIIGAAIVVHRELGPGLLESAYEACLAFELAEQAFQVERQKPLPVTYRGAQLDCGYRLDLLIENQVILELKTVERLLPIHDAQLLSYLKMAQKKVGLLINFHSLRVKDGIKRIVNNY